MKMNKVQREYAVAKAAREAAEEVLSSAEKAYIKEHGIVNDDGSVPEEIWMIKDEEMFDKANEGFEKEHSELTNAFLAASKALDDAEDALISWGISIAPAGIRETLEKSRKDYRYRSRLIDLAFRVDPRTVPKI